ncbi:hypothetical protein E2C01_050739 [Portunus trituberculatus]|uniref:Uncharacterized protein n=1 Tax=Portunus trituberculatus TaxID=210409 RepID=A0A5B7GJS2_PORTR|nr:hypothetical protein [Portunus trituberculatus]
MFTVYCYPDTSFAAELNKLYKANDLPIIIIPEDPPSTAILNIMTKNTSDNTSTKCNTAVPTQPNTNTNNTPSRTSKKALDNIPLIQNTSTTTVNNTQQEDMPVLEKISGTQLGIPIITKKSEGWLKDTFSLNYLKSAIDKSRFKWRFNNTVYNEKEIYVHLINNGIDLANCWCIMDDALFNKIQSGKTGKRTPPPPIKSTKTHHRHPSK